MKKIKFKIKTPIELVKLKNFFIDKFKKFTKFVKFKNVKFFNNYFTDKFNKFNKCVKQIHPICLTNLLNLLKLAI